MPSQPWLLCTFMHTCLILWLTNKNCYNEYCLLSILCPSLQNDNTISSWKCSSSNISIYYFVFVIMISGWSGGAKVRCILRHQGAQLILAYSWTRPAILVAGKGRGECFYFFCFFLFIPVLYLSCYFLWSPLLIILSLFSLSLGDDTKWPTRVDVSFNPNTNCYKYYYSLSFLTQWQYHLFMEMLWK